MNPRAVQLLALAAAAALVAGASTLMPAINADRKAMNVASITAESPLENAPPEYAFAIQAFGAFRGLLTNILFIRANDYKEQGRYFDAMELASLICKLQPRFPSVWEFQSWNMAWNISVTTYTPDERWNWVYNGAKLIRDDGLRYNPRAVNLYKQLAWIFVNKMSETIDDFHLTYKRNWAWRMHLVLGDRPDPLREHDPNEPILDFGEVGDDPLLTAARIAKQQQERKRQGADPTAGDSALPVPTSFPTAVARASSAPANPDLIVQQACHDLIAAIDAAPASLQALYAQTPAARDLVQQLARIGANIDDRELNEDSYFRADGLAFTFFERYRKITDAGAMVARLARNAQPDPDAENVAAFEKIVGPRGQSPAAQALLRYLQRRVLREVYKLDTGFMTTLVDQFGPIDWRSVDAHGLYWCTLGIIRGGETISAFGNDKTNTARLIFFALRNLYLRNRITFEPYAQHIALSYINFNPDLAFIRPLHEAYLKYAAELDPDPGPGAGNTYKAGHINFLTESIRLLWLADRRQEATQYYEYLRNTYFRNDDGSLNRAFDKPLDRFVLDSLYDGIEGPRETRMTVQAILIEAFDELGRGNVQRYNALANKSYEFYEVYMQEKARYTSEHHKLPPFPDMQADALAQYMRLPSLNPGAMLHKVRLWSLLPQSLRRPVYDFLIEGLRAECQWYDFDPEKSFPEPQGMAEFREKWTPRGPQEQPKTFETPVQVP